MNSDQKQSKKTKDQADFLVAPLNQKITRAIHISDKSYESYNNFNGELQEVVVMGYLNNSKQEYEPPAIEFKPIKVESEVTVKFGID